VAFAVVIGVVVAFPALRLGGLSLALATLALGFVGDNVLFEWSWLGGPFQQGWSIPRPSLGPLHFSDDKTLAVLLALMVILVTVLIRNLQRSASGRMMMAVRASESAAETSGISGMRVKISLFAVSAALAGLGGVMLVTVDQHVTDSTYTTITGLTWLAAVVLWGIRRPSAAILAGLSTSLFNGFLSSGFHFSFMSWSGTSSVWFPQVLFGLGAVTMSQNPDGILALQEEQSFRRKKKRAERALRRATQADPSRDVVQPASHPDLPVTGDPQVPAGAGAQRANDELALRLDAVNAAYGETQVLFDVDLALRRGKLTALVGANGAGKSTLCKVIAGLVDTTKGAVYLGSREITRLPAHRRSHDLLLAPESRGIFPSLSVADNLAVLLPSPAEREQAFDRFPVLRTRRAVPAGHLSGGEQQMLTMAPVIVKPPKLLIADEPTLGLAPIIVSQIIQVFADLRDAGVTLLIVEERAKAILDVADDVALLELGRLIWSGPRSALDNEQLAAIYLGQAKTENEPRAPA
jgi:ABC-type branched-subunit amino acid transport system ATPase component/ABC-type branched-subunit amino acid transport system permease subunit